MRSINMHFIGRDSPGITPLITAFRHEGLTFVVLPYIQFDHFDVGFFFFYSAVVP